MMIIFFWEELICADIDNVNGNIIIIIGQSYGYYKISDTTINIETICYYCDNNTNLISFLYNLKWIFNCKMFIIIII